jgi:phage terminase large subunit GpA-like protein
VAEERSRDHRASMLSKSFRGGLLILTGANSAVGLRSMPVRWLLLDEIDGYPVDVDGEGSPVELAEARQRTFARLKRMKCSTPTIAGRSLIEHAYLSSDMRRYFVPCPKCGGYQTLDFALLQWSKYGRPPGEAVYECLYCEEQIQDHQKTAMLARGEWRPTSDEPANPKVRGYHINALYSPVGWISWGDIAEQFARDHKDPAKYRVFVNTVLGETWQERGEAPEWERLYARREDYAEGTVPAAALMLTAGVDVQKDRLVVEVVAWGRGKESWSVMYGEIPGDSSDLKRGPWKLLDELLSRTFTSADGRELPIAKLAVDSGYNTMAVYSWARTHHMSQVISVKGVPGIGALIGAPSNIEITARGAKPAYGYKVWPVHGAVAKGELYGFLRLDTPLDGEPCPPGYCHFPMYDDDYFKQLTAEHLVTHQTRGGFVKLEWEMIPGRENHVLDCRVYARAAASLAGMDRWKAPGVQVAQAPKPKPERKGWLTRGRD